MNKIQSEVEILNLGNFKKCLQNNQLLQVFPFHSNKITSKIFFSPTNNKKIFLVLKINYLVAVAHC